MLDLFEEDEIVDVLTEVSRSGMHGQCTSVLRRRSDIVLTSLVQTFKIRAAAIADYAHNARGNVGEGTDFLKGLDETERKRASRECRAAESVC